MEPTEAEIETFQTVEDLARWAGMTGEVDNPQSSVGSFFTLMGFAKQEHWRTMAILADSDLDNILNNWNTQCGSMFMKTSPAQLAQARLLSLAAKVKGRKPHCKCNPYAAEKEKPLVNVDTRASSAPAFVHKTIAFPTFAQDVRADRKEIWMQIISTLRLCSPGRQVFREGRAWLTFPLRCDTNVQCSDCYYSYNGKGKNPCECVIGYHNTRLESLTNATPSWSGDIGSGILVDGRLRYGSCTHNGCSGVNIYSDGGYETFAGSQGWVQLELRCSNTTKLQGGRQHRYCIRGPKGEICYKASLFALWIPYGEVPTEHIRNIHNQSEADVDNSVQLL